MVKYINLPIQKKMKGNERRIKAKRSSLRHITAKMITAKDKQNLETVREK